MKASTLLKLNEWKEFFKDIIQSVKDYANRNREADTGLICPDLLNPATKPQSFTMHPVHYELHKTMKPANSGGIYKTPPKEYKCQ